MTDDRQTDHPFQTGLHVGQINLPSWERFEQEFRAIFDRNFFASHGPLESKLEAALAEYLNVRHVVCTVNATVALMLTARALDISGDVIVPSFTFAATAQAISWAGLNPVFCDVDEKTHNLSASLVERCLTERTAGILGVHLWGRACDVDGLEELARSRKIELFFDSAHALGCSHRGKRIGSFGRAEIFSFHATKVLNGTEGGCISTNDHALAARLRTMRTFHGNQTFAKVPLRLNGRISESQAAMALMSLEDLTKNIDANRTRYFRYRERLTDITSLEFIDHAANEASNYQYVVVRVLDSSPLSRGRILSALQAKNIFARDYFSPPVHRMKPYRDKPQPVLGVTESLSSSLIQLPTGHAISIDDVDAVCDVLHSIMKG